MYSRSKLPLVKIAVGEKCRRSKWPSVKNSVGQNGCRSKIPSVKMANGQKFRHQKKNVSFVPTSPYSLFFPIQQSENDE
jgi:hypothetical protein